MYAIMSDVHGNIFAFQKVLEDLKQFQITGILFLGDLIDYGMQSNEVIDYIRDKLEYRIICNLWGNHEHAIMNDNYSDFSTLRGVECAKYTASRLTELTRSYINCRMNNEGYQRIELGKCRCLAVHGSLYNKFWKAIDSENTNGNYSEFDVVFSGHSHYSHVFTKFYECEDSNMRNKHSVLFINPGSIGQPRNHNSSAQYALFDEKYNNIYLRSIPYDIDKAIATFDDSVDKFYKERLRFGV